MKWDKLKADIAEVIRTNGNHEITGQVLQTTLLQIVSSIGANASFAGVATLATRPTTPDGAVFYLAGQEGKYVEFGGLEIASGELAVIEWSGVSWVKTTLIKVSNDTSLADKVTALETNVTALDGEIEALETNVTALGGEVTNLGNSITGLAQADTAIAKQLQGQADSITANTTAIEDLNTQIGDIESRSVIRLQNAINNIAITNSGKFDTSTTYMSTDYIRISDVKSAYLYEYTYYKGISFFSKEKKYLGFYDFGESAGYRNIDFNNMDIPESAFYVIFTVLSTKDYYVDVYVEKYNNSNLEDIRNDQKEYNIFEKVQIEYSSNKGKNILRSNVGGIQPSWTKYYFEYEVDEDCPVDTTDVGISLIYSGGQTTLGKLAPNQPILIDTIDVPKGYYINLYAYKDFDTANIFSIRVTYTNAETVIENQEKRISENERQIKLLTDESGFWINKTIAILGDSISEFKDTEGKRYSDRIAEKTKANVLNFAIGGTRLLARTIPTLNPSTNTEGYAGLDIPSIVNAICDIDNYKQIVLNSADYIKNNANDDNTKSVESLMALDFNNVDALIIQGGSNDFTGESVIENLQSSISSIISNISQKYPDIKIYWFTPPVHRYRVSESATDTEYYSDNYQNSLGNKLTDYIKAIIDTVENYGIPICNLYKTLCINKYNFWNYFPAGDGSHLNKTVKGSILLSEKIISFIKSNKLF